MVVALYADRRVNVTKTHDVKVILDVIGYTVPEGDSLLIMVSPGSFPTLWPSPAPTNITIMAGTLSLPTTDIDNDQGGKMFSRPDMKPRLGPCKVVDTLREGSFSRDLSFSLSGDKRKITVRTDEGCKYYPDVDTEVEEINEDVYTITGDDPLTAEVYCYRKCIITYQVNCKC